MEMYHFRLKSDKKPDDTRISSDHYYSYESLISIIADAILREPYAVPLVARFNGEDLKMEKNLELMSEFEKDELVIKKIIREL